MIIEAIIGFVLGLLYQKIDDALELDWVVKVIIIIVAILVLGYIGILGVTFMICYVVGYFLYREYVSQRW